MSGCQDFRRERRLRVADSVKSACSIAELAPASSLASLEQLLCIMDEVATLTVSNGTRFVDSHVFLSCHAT